MSTINELIKNINSKCLVVSKFLTLEEQAQLNKIKNKTFIPSGTERKRVLFNNNIDEIDYNNYISVLKITYNKKFGEINHRDVLGALIGLGIKRECIGDIIVSDNIYVYIIKEMEQFITDNLYQIGKVTVNSEICDINILNDINVCNYVEDTFIVSSYRLDTIVSERCALSREKAKQYIILKNVKVNGIINSNPDYIVKINDLISIHRYGRLIIKEEIKKTKKDKYVLKINKTL